MNITDLDFDALRAERLGEINNIAQSFGLSDMARKRLIYLHGMAELIGVARAERLIHDGGKALNREIEPDPAGDQTQG